MVAQFDDAGQWEEADAEVPAEYPGEVDERYRWIDMLRALTGNALTGVLLLALLAAVPVAFTVIREDRDTRIDGSEDLTIPAVLAAEVAAPDDTAQAAASVSRPEYVDALAPYLRGAANPVYLIAVGPSGVHRITGAVDDPRTTRFDAPAGASDPTLPAPERTDTGVAYYTMQDEALMLVTVPLDGSGPTRLAATPTSAAAGPSRPTVGPRASNGLRAIPQPAGGIVVTAPDGTPHPLTDLPIGSVTDVAWAGGGTAVAVTLETGGSGTSGLWLCDLRSGCTQLVIGSGVRMAR